MGLIAQQQQTPFANPQNGQSPIDADVVRLNDNALTAKHNAHDADATLHVQTGTLAARPAAGTLNAMYLDENGRFYRDNGTAWVELPYARLDAAGTNAFTNNVTVGGTLGVTGTTTLGTVNAGAVSATSFTGAHSGSGSGLTGITVSAANVTPGNFPTGNYDIDGTLNANAVTVDNGQMRGRRITQTGAGGTVSFATANHVRHTMTGNGTLTLAGGVAGGVYTVEVLQDGTGGRTVTWSGATWEAGIAPTSTTTANRKDVFTFFFDGSAYLGVVFGLNFASTA